MDIQKVSILCESLATKFDRGDVVLIGGLSKSGKTTFSERLRLASLRRNLTARTLSLDRWLKDADSRSPGVMGRYDLAEIQKVLLRRSAGNANEICLQLPEYDKYMRRKSFDGKSILIRPDDVLIVEGTIALTLAERIVRAHCFYLEIEESVRRLRVIDEYLSRGQTSAEAERIYADRQLDEVPVIKQSSAHAIRIDPMNIQ